MTGGVTKITCTPNGSVCKVALTFNYFPKTVRDESIGVTNSQGRTQNTFPSLKKVEWRCNLAHAHLGCSLVNLSDNFHIRHAPCHAPMDSSRPCAFVTPPSWKTVEWCNLAAMVVQPCEFLSRTSIFVTPPVTPPWIRHDPIRSSRPHFGKKLNGRATFTDPFGVHVNFYLSPPSSSRPRSHPPGFVTAPCVSHAPILEKS